MKKHLRIIIGLTIIISSVILIFFIKFNKLERTLILNSYKFAGTFSTPIANIDNENKIVNISLNYNVGNEDKRYKQFAKISNKYKNLITTKFPEYSDYCFTLSFSCGNLGKEFIIEDFTSECPQKIHTNLYLDISQITEYFSNVRSLDVLHFQFCTEKDFDGFNNLECIYLNKNTDNKVIMNIINDKFPNCEIIIR